MCLMPRKLPEALGPEAGLGNQEPSAVRAAGGGRGCPWQTASVLVNRACVRAQVSLSSSAKMRTCA